ncbi:DoxX family protein [Gallaecimonas sp. GXIMD4217]|uniref:DoxX family protein n=1 Tax=Gallaecimonas sp. GXIMD4217 TaxID=3131927 RepID=UPI00311B31A7
MHTTWLPLAGRILLALIFLLSGLHKIGGYADTQAYMEQMGVPGLLLPAVIMVEVGGGAALILGWFTRWAALALAVFTLLAAMLFHADFNDQMQFIMFMKNLAITGGLLMLAAHGAGCWSLDARLSKGKG